MAHTIADAHVEFIHDPNDEAGLPDPSITHDQITPEQIDLIKPELLFLACWVEPTPDAWEKLNRIIDGYLVVIKEHGWRLVTTADDLNKPGIKIILHLEDAAAIAQPEQLGQLVKRGVRSVGLTHNPLNQYAGGSLSADGLTPAGVELIREIARQGCLLDWAHLGPQSIIDVAARFPNLPPFISHAGLWAAHKNPRNIRPSALKLVAERSGWVGIGLAQSFLSAQNATLMDYQRQIAIASQICGPDRVGVGSDLGGIVSGLPTDIRSFGDIPALQSVLADKKQAGQTLLDFLPQYFLAMAAAS